MARNHFLDFLNTANLENLGLMDDMLFNHQDAIGFRDSDSSRYRELLIVELTERGNHGPKPAAARKPDVA